MPYGLTTKQVEILAEHLARHVGTDPVLIKAAIDSFTRAEVKRIAKGELRGPCMKA